MAKLLRIWGTTVLLVGLLLLPHGCGDVVLAKERVEQEPNDTFQQADRMYPDSTVLGRINKENDVDTWKLEGDGVRRFRITLEKDQQKGGFELLLFNQTGELIKKADETGDQLVLEGITIPAGEWQMVQVMAEQGREHQTYRLLVSVIPWEEDAWEPNNSVSQAVPLEMGKGMSATFHRREDIDIYSLTTRLYSEWEVQISGLQAGSQVQVSNASGTILAKAVGGNQGKVTLRLDLPPGTAYLKVSPHPGKKVHADPYTILAKSVTVPVILVPGFGGTRLLAKENGKVKEAWLNLEEILHFNNKEHLRLLSLMPKKQGSPEVVPRHKGIAVYPEPEDGGFRAVTRITYHPMGYDESEQFDTMIRHLESLGYEKNRTLYAFPYDWRLSNVHNGKLFRAKMDAVRKQTGASQVQVIAFSMGGVLVREALLAQPVYQKQVKRLIYIGTPLLGTPLTYHALRFGHHFGIGLKLSDQATLKLFSEKVGKEIARFMPSVYELLPFEEYVKRQSYLNFIGISQKRPFTFQEIQKDKRIAVPYQPLADWASRQQRRWVSQSLSVPQYAVIGEGQTTLLGYDYHQNFNRLTPFFGKAGDGTVPLASAAYQQKGLRKQYFITEEHTRLPRNPVVIRQVSQLLNGMEAAVQGMRSSSAVSGEKDWLEGDSA
jgi:pimeloyl-ACP methyl ester carboxylesterase